jgi:hypothetical protein
MRKPSFFRNQRLVNRTRRAGFDMDQGTGFEPGDLRQSRRFLTPLVTAALPVPERDEALLLVRPHPPGLSRCFRFSRLIHR